MSEHIPRKAGIGAYIALIFAVIFFSGISVSPPAKQLGEKIAQLADVEPKVVHDIFSVFDFNTLNGKFGQVAAKGEGVTNFAGKDGVGARQGFMFALTLIPTTLLAMGIIAVLEHYGALEAMRRLLQNVLRPLMGVPGETGLAMIASMQSTDAGAALTRGLYEEGKINDRERDIFAMFQFSAGATITNFLSSGASLLALTAVVGGVTETVPASIGLCLGVIFVFKFIGANLMRLYLNFSKNKEVQS